MLTCKRCGHQETCKYMEHVQKFLEERRLCFKCNFWYEYVLRKDDDNVVRIDGVHYVIGPEDAPAGCSRGFGGRRFNIKFFKDDAATATTNLWHQGKIPDRFRDELPDNAEFVA